MDARRSDAAGPLPPPTPAVTPALTVVMPTHDRRELVLRSLRALAGQSGVPAGAFDVVLVADGCGDGTVAAVSELELPYRLHILEQPSGGVAVARNAGWRRATAEIVLFLDDDIIASPNLVAEHIRAHAAHPAAVVLGRFSPDYSTRRSAWTRYEEWLQEKKYAAMERDEAPSGLRFYSGNVSVRREHLELVEGFDHSMVRNEDVDLGFRLEQAGLTFFFVPAADALHVGYRDFEGWRRVPTLYGRLDVSMYNRGGYGGGLGAIVACFHDRNPLNRLAVRYALRSRDALLRTDEALSWAALTLDSMHLESLSRFALSALYNVLYWAGVRDGLRGNQAFWQMVRATRRDPRRPYRRAAAPQR